MKYRSLIMLCLGFSSGLPLVLTGSTLQAWYTQSGVSLLAIGALTLVGQPYTWKFLWSPLVDRYQLLRLGKTRSWIFVMQLALVISLSSMAFLKPTTMPWTLSILAVIVACFSATQDIAIDAYRTDLYEADEQGIAAGMYTLGYRLAVMVAGAFALIVAQLASWRTTYCLMAALVFVLMLATLALPNPRHQSLRMRTLKAAVLRPALEFLRRPYALWVLLLIITYKLCDAVALSLNTTFLLRGLHFTLIEVGSISKIVGLVAVLLGSVVGGALSPRLGLYRALMIFGFLQAFSNLSFALLAAVGKNMLLMGSSIFVENFCSGLSSVAFIVFLSELCNRRYTATQYALFSATASFGRVYAGPFAAMLVKHIGWVDFYIVSFIIGLPCLLLLYWLGRAKELTGITLIRRQVI